MDYIGVFFTLIFAVPLNFALCSLIISMSIKQCHSVLFLTHHRVYISVDIQHDISFPIDPMCFQSVPVICLNSAYYYQLNIVAHHIQGDLKWVQ